MAGVTQEELAKVIGVSQSAISQIERGATEPMKITVRAIANYFGVDESEIKEVKKDDGNTDNTDIDN